MKNRVAHMRTGLEFYSHVTDLANSGPLLTPAEAFYTTKILARRDGGANEDMPVSLVLLSELENRLDYVDTYQHWGYEFSDGQALQVLKDHGISQLNMREMFQRLRDVLGIKYRANIF
uniref:Uncharacterized protein n=1 Tax=Peronospora matthiolae TaxID=2874970 RepID=A0AAV1UL98_9STRA